VSLIEFLYIFTDCVVEHTSIAISTCMCMYYTSKCTETECDV